MKLDVAVCPDFHDLERLLLGEVSGEEQSALERHLADCPRCGETLAQIQTSDTLLARLQAQANPVRGQQVATATEERLCAAPSALELDAAESVDVTMDTAATWREVLAAPDQPDELGRLGGYRVLSVLGTGAMGIVFRAEDLQLHRTVALKVMKPLLAVNDGARKRFLREARAVAALSHDHIVPIFHVGEDRGLPFLAMPLLAGQSLAARLQKEPPLSFAEIRTIGRQIADGLAAAHARGMVHRDIKPANIWLEAHASAPEGFRVKLLDFGLARGVGDDTHLTDPGAIMGTPAFMSPEQARGDTVDARSDLFSLGCVLYRLCTRRVPFKGNDPPSTLLSLMMDEPQPPRQLAPEVPAPLSDYIMKLIAKDPADRPDSASDVATTLANLDVRGYVQASVMPRRDRSLIWYAIASSILLLIGAVWGGPIVFRIYRGDDPTQDIELKPCEKCEVVADTEKKPEPAPDTRGRCQYFAYDRPKENEGAFKLTGKDAWTETCPDGVVFSFKEVARTREYVELYDENRKIGIRLHDKHEMWRHPELTKGEWHQLAVGAWRDLPKTPSVCVLRSCDFTDGGAHGTRSHETRIVDRKIWGSDEGHLMRFYNAGNAWMEADFELASDPAKKPGAFVLEVKHLCSKRKGGLDGFSPVVIFVNGQEAWKGSPMAGEWIVDSIDIANHVRAGKNTLRWEMQPDAATHYWLKAFHVKLKSAPDTRKYDSSKNDFK